MNFDRYARQYDLELEKGIRLSGEGKEFFARGRLAAVRDYFARTGAKPLRMIEFGCGIGTNIGVIREFWPRMEITGLDLSEESLGIAREKFGDDGIRFLTPDGFRAAGGRPADWVFCAGVLHHIPVAERIAALTGMRALLRQGGCLTLFDNNPLNPGARLVMRRIPFDRDAVMQSPYPLRGALSTLGFEDITLRFYFIFPRPLGFLRALEPPVSRLPFGAQYGVFARSAPPHRA